MRGWWGSAVGRLRRDWTQVLEAVLAATLAWVVAAWVIGHPDPFFAPTAALIVLGEARGRRIRQTVEVLLGVAAGVLVADVVAQALGPGAPTMFLVLLLTVGIMVTIGASSTLVVQAAISALYVVVVSPPTETLVPFRFLDALIGGVVALAVSQLVVARDPLAPLVAEARQTFIELAVLLDRIDDALARCDEDAARAALDRARELDGCVDRLREAVRACGEALRFRVRMRRHVHQVREVEATARQLDYAVRNIRVLARAGVTLSRCQPTAPPELGAAIRALADAVRAAGDALATDLTGCDDCDRHVARAETAALEAVRIGARLLAAEPALPLIMIVGQIRSTAIDLLRGLGQDDAAVLGRVDEVAGLPSV
ncbi:FUSC family protein [Micromonospora cathayae]|uniref:FUSC family protein n=1 Tax=Micromonospora cathayae TaxID=3028804 RepID=A0ABY7ZL66_9ACTN|nr:FUSC family protein [Micromonospora sp. HUAS 3]WDZ83268.1 FUSC family protein [Micromonospora sp. HUAS 3]